MFYNSKRRHSYLGYLSSMEYEKNVFSEKLFRKLSTFI